RVAPGPSHRTPRGLVGVVLRADRQNGGSSVAAVPQPAGACCGAGAAWGAADGACCAWGKPCGAGCAGGAPNAGAGCGAGAGAGAAGGAGAAAGACAGAEPWSKNAWAPAARWYHAL